MLLIIYSTPFLLTVEAPPEFCTISPTENYGLEYVIVFSIAFAAAYAVDQAAWKLNPPVTPSTLSNSPITYNPG